MYAHSGQSLTFAIIGGNTNDVFKLVSDDDASCQHLMVAKDALNYEAKNSYSLEISVTDNGTPPLNGMPPACLVSC